MVVARQTASRTDTVPLGERRSTACPVSPTIHSRPMVGVENRVRTMAGIPPTIPIPVPTTPTPKVIHESDTPSKRNTEPTTSDTVPMTDQVRGTPA